MIEKLSKRKVQYTFGFDREGNWVRIPLKSKPYDDIDDLVRPKEFTGEDPEEFLN